MRRCLTPDDVQFGRVYDATIGEHRLLFRSGSFDGLWTVAAMEVPAGMSVSEATPYLNSRVAYRLDEKWAARIGGVNG